ncbi:MAG: NAD(P)/FAD-dependent oxidoreductase, partial [Candidatus Margulisiibacteriota bacterium]
MKSQAPNSKSQTNSKLQIPNAERKYDLIVVGAGPAGMMAAVRAGERGLKVLIAEKNDSAGKKLLICGNGRCNVTNAEKDPATFCFNYMKNPKFMLSMLRNYSNLDVMGFFEGCGIALKVEPGLKVFPKSNKAGDFLDALLDKLSKLKVKIIYEAPVEDLLT